VRPWENGFKRCQQVGGAGGQGLAGGEGEGGRID
tara:strand:+ start:211 stop:312 length:102 start_codon:yes stop_codon:yes gene_type:complete